MARDHRRWLVYQVDRLRRAGHSQRQIAKALGIARRTVVSLLDDLQQRRRDGESALEQVVPRRVPKASKLDPFEERMRAWLQEFKDLTAVRCLELLEKEGFKGAYTIVRERIAKLRAELHPPRPTATPVVTAPGQRAEFDWSPYNLGGGLKIQLWNATLRWSRAPSLAPATNYRQTTTLRLLREAFEAWGGVPRECLTDSMPGVVDRWEFDEPVLNTRYIDFAAHYGFTALIAPRGSPKWKAVVERRFRSHETGLLNGRTFTTFDHYREELARYQERCLRAPHPETGRPIVEMFELERPHLNPLPARPYDTRDVLIRVVDDYGRVQCDTNHYPVPAPPGSVVYACASPEHIEFCDRRARRLIEYERLPDGARIKLDPPHVRRVRYDLDELVERVGRWGEIAQAFAVGVREARRYAGPQLVRIIQLQLDWSPVDIVAAMEQALAYRAFEAAKLQRILELRFSPRPYTDRIACATRQRIREVMAHHPVRQRPLSAYEALRRGDRAPDRHPDNEEDNDDGANRPPQATAGDPGDSDP